MYTDGNGNGRTSPNLVEYDDTLVKLVLENGKKGIISRMPSFNGKLAPEDIEALTSYISTLKE